MKLIDKETGDAIAAVEDGALVLYNRHLEDELKLMGIPIPPVEQDAFEGLDIIPYGHKLFARAFFEVYYPFHMNISQFEIIN